jgi:HlyD family secretion protein
VQTGPATFGFPQQPGERRPESIHRPTPLPKRPKGRWFVGLLLAGLCGVAGYKVWHAYFRYEAYGTVAGRLVHVSPAWDGTIQAIHVREGDRVRQGQVLVTLDDLALRHQQARLADEMRIARARLEAEVARLKWYAATAVVDRHGQAVAEYYAAWGRLVQEQARLEELRLAEDRALQLQKGQALAAADLDQVHYARLGLGRRIDKMALGVEELRKRLEWSTDLLQGQADPRQGLAEQGQDQLKPLAVKIQAVQTEMTCNQERLARSQVSAPTDGLVVTVQRFPGEHCKADEPLLVLLEEGSLEIVLYLPQASSHRLAVGDATALRVEPYPEPATCTVVRLGDQYEPAPENLKRYYAAGQKLLPVHLRPRAELAQWMALRVGGVVQLPRGLRPFPEGDRP